MNVNAFRLYDAAKAKRALAYRLDRLFWVLRDLSYRGPALEHLARSVRYLEVEAAGLVRQALAELGLPPVGSQLD